MDEDRIKSIIDFKRPQNLKNLRGFLGLLNYFKKLIPDLSEKELPLIKLLNTYIKWKWENEQENLFIKIKQEFTKNLTIYHPQYDKLFILRTDASINQFAGMLIQISNEIEVLICFVSRVTKDYIIRFSIPELEFASI